MKAINKNGKITIYQGVPQSFTSSQGVHLNAPNMSEQALKDAMEATDLEYSLNPGEGAFYGPKLEFVLRDAIGRDWQCGTLQVDLNLPGRLGATFVDEDGQKKTPVMLHRALFGSLERFAGILIEHYAGHLPIWLSPVQVVIATITSDTDNYGYEVLNKMKSEKIRAEIDTRNEKIGYKISVLIFAFYLF